MSKSTRHLVSPTARASWFSQWMPAGTVAALAGAGLAWTYAGFVGSACRLLDPTPLTFRLALGAALLATALGLRLPRRSAWRFATGARGWLERSDRMVTSSSGTDRALLWMVVGIVGLVSSLSALVLPFWCDLAGALLAGGMREFLWSPGTLTVFEALALLLAAAPLACLGLFLRCVHHLGCPAGRWSFAAVVWVTTGLGIGLATTALVSDAWLTGAFLLRGAAVPLLCAALIAVWQATPAPNRRTQSPAQQGLDEPDIGQRWPVILRLSVAACVTATVTAGIIWVYVAWAVGIGRSASAPLAAGVLIGAAAAGLGVAVRRAAKSDHQIGAWGLRAALAGVLLAGGAAVFSVVIAASYVGFIRGPGGWLLWLLCAGGPMGVGGYVAGYGALAVLRRSAYASATGAAILQTILLAAALACACIALVLFEWLGSYATLVAAALALLATGGMLVIHEPVSHTQRGRIAAVFAAVVLMAWLMPWAGGGWLRQRGGPRGQLIESWRLTAEVLDQRRRGATEDTRQAAALAAIDWRRLPTDARVGVMSLFGEAPAASPAGFRGRLQRLAMVANPMRVPDAPRDEPASAWRALRAGPQRYDVLVVLLAGVPEELGASLWRHAMPRWMGRRLAPDGVVLALLEEDQAADPTALWNSMPDAGALFPDQASVVVDGQTYVALFGGLGTGFRENARRWSAATIAARGGAPADTEPLPLAALLPHDRATTAGIMGGGIEHVRE